MKVEKNQKDITILSEIKQKKRFDIVILSVAHDVFSKINPIKLLNKKGFVFNPLKWSWALSDRDLSVNYVTASLNDEES